MKQQGDLKGSVRQKIGKVGLIIAAVRIILIGFLMLPADDPPGNK